MPKQPSGAALTPALSQREREPSSSPSGRGGGEGKSRPPGVLSRPLRLLWSVTFDAFHDFVWGDLKDGVLDLRGLTLPVRALVWLGFTLLIVMTGAMLVGDTWRQTFDLVPLTQGIPGRGRLVPAAVIPAVDSSATRAIP